MAFPQNKFNGLDMNMGSLSRLSDAKTRSISPKTLTEKREKPEWPILLIRINPMWPNAANAARDLGQGWKVNPYIRIKPGETFTLADIEGPGAIQHIWMTPAGKWRYSILRIYWDGETDPSVESAQSAIFSEWVGNLFKAYFTGSLCKTPGVLLTVTGQCHSEKNAGLQWKISEIDDLMTLFYQIDYT